MKRLLVNWAFESYIFLWHAMFPLTCCNQDVSKVLILVYTVLLLIFIIILLFQILFYKKVEIKKIFTICYNKD